MPNNCHNNLGPGGGERSPDVRRPSLSSAVRPCRVQVALQPPPCQVLADLFWREWCRKASQRAERWGILATNTTAPDRSRRRRDTCPVSFMLAAMTTLKTYTMLYSLTNHLRIYTALDFWWRWLPSIIRLMLSYNIHKSLHKLTNSYFPCVVYPVMQYWNSLCPKFHPHPPTPPPCNDYYPPHTLHILQVCHAWG